MKHKTGEEIASELRKRPVPPMDRVFDWIPWIILSVGFVVIVGFGVALYQETNSFHEWCESQGGSIMHLWKSNICVSNDGRIIRRQDGR